MKRTLLILTAVFLLVGAVSALYNDVRVDTDVSGNINTDGAVANNVEADIGVEGNLDFGQSTEVEADELEVVADLDSSVDPASITSTSDLRISSGFGWVTIDNSATTQGEGDFARVILVERAFMTATDAEERYVLTRGIVRIHSRPTFQVSRDSRETLGNEFTVRQNGAVVGKLTLDEERRMDSFVIWNGELTLDSGERYKLEFATRERTILVTPKPGVKVDSNLNGEFEAQRRPVSVMTRLRAIFS